MRSTFALVILGHGAIMCSLARAHPWKSAENSLSLDSGEKIACDVRQYYLVLKTYSVEVYCMADPSG